MDSGTDIVPKNSSTPRKLRWSAVSAISAVLPWVGIWSSHSSCHSTFSLAFSFTEVWYFSLPRPIVTKQSFVSVNIH